MCSFLFTNKNINNVDEVNFFLKRRGPDATNCLIFQDFLYLHNLLSITGEKTVQPFLGKKSILLYNGEIYNYQDFGDYKSDGQCILDLYENLGTKSFQMIDGEFSIVLHDYEEKKIYLCTDTFGTKPLFYAINGDKIGVSSYESSLKRSGFQNIIKAKPNKITIIDQTLFKVINEIELYSFDINQYKTTYEDWDQSFIKSIKKRVKNIKHNIVLPLSSGYDSGLISCIFNQEKIDYISISVRGRENQEILNKRLELKEGIKYIHDIVSLQEISRVKQLFIETVEDFSYGPNPYEKMFNGHEDHGAIGLFLVLEEAKIKNNCKISFSGHGADEMMSNIKGYGFKTPNPSPFPEDLKTVFPWGNFYYGSQSSYLSKEECVAGSLGIETRYPFLDRELVQEFLWLDHKLKNYSYKAPIEFSLKKRNFPYFVGSKMGFNLGF